MKRKMRLGRKNNEREEATKKKVGNEIRLEMLCIDEDVEEKDKEKG